jgi:hypothetical protein
MIFLVVIVVMMTMTRVWAQPCSPASFETGTACWSAKGPQGEPLACGADGMCVVATIDATRVSGGPCFIDNRKPDGSTDIGCDMRDVCVNVAQWGLVDVFASTYGRCMEARAIPRNFNNRNGADCEVGTATKASVCWSGTSENGQPLVCQNGKCVELRSREPVVDGPCLTNFAHGVCPESSACIKSGKLGDIVAFPLPNHDGRCVKGAAAVPPPPAGPLCAFTPEEQTSDVGCYCEKGGVGKCISSFAGEKFMLNSYYGFVAPPGNTNPAVGCYFSKAGNGTAFSFTTVAGPVTPELKAQQKAFVDECGTVTGVCSAKRGKCSDCHVGDEKMGTRVPAFYCALC